MAIYGSVTKRDLSKFGAHATAALVALIIASVINMFLQSPAITYIFFIYCSHYLHCIDRLGCPKNEEHLFALW